eukprot:8881713-Prorocentrum_lima.AAC.1
MAIHKYCWMNDEQQPLVPAPPAEGAAVAAGKEAATQQANTDAEVEAVRTAEAMDAELQKTRDKKQAAPVSYTHLTLPTICSV